MNRKVIMVKTVSTGQDETTGNEACDKDFNRNSEVDDGCPEG